MVGHISGYETIGEVPPEWRSVVEPWVDMAIMFPIFIYLDEQNQVLHVDYGGTDNVPDLYRSCIRVNRVLG